MFGQALKENRAVFVDYFLRRYHDPLETSDLIENEKDNIEWINEKTKKSKGIASISANNFSTVSMVDNTRKEQPVDEFSLEDKVFAIYALNFILKDLYEHNKKAPVKVRCTA